MRAASEALEAGAEITFAVVSPGLDRTAGGSALRARLFDGARRTPIDVEEVDDDEMADLADTRTPQGVLLVAREPRDEISALEGRRLLVLDAIQDPGNLGTLVRSAVAFGLDGVVCLDGTVDPWGAKAVRASAGMVFRLPVVSCPETAAVQRLRALGLTVVIADVGGVPVADAVVGPDFAVVIGNEGAGARSSLLEVADVVVAVRMRGPAESLNAGVAGSIVMHTLTGKDAVE